MQRATSNTDPLETPQDEGETHDLAESEKKMNSTTRPASPAQITARRARADRDHAARAAAVAAAAGSKEAGRKAGIAGVVALHGVLSSLRAEVAADPVAAAVATTYLLHALVGEGPRSDGDSLAAAGNADRAEAVRQMLATLDRKAVGEILGVSESRVGEIAGASHRRASAA